MFAYIANSVKRIKKTTALKGLFFLLVKTDYAMLPMPQAVEEEGVVSHKPSSEITIQAVWKQFNDRIAQAELKNLEPKNVDWVSRTRVTLQTLLPQFPKLAKEIKEAVPNYLNATVKIKTLLEEGRAHLEQFFRHDRKLKLWYEDLLSVAELAPSAIGHFESQQISAAIQRFIVSDSRLADILTSNGKSIYPDLVIKTSDYSMLRHQLRKSPIDGPSLRGDHPSNVPDGCEIKTNRGNKIRVDAHGAHPGLHLGVTWEHASCGIEITGVWVAYVRIADHRESGRNVNVTTVKYSFGHDLFSPLLF